MQFGVQAIAHTVPPAGWSWVELVVQQQAQAAREGRRSPPPSQGSLSLMAVTVILAGNAPVSAQPALSWQSVPY